MPTPQGTAFHAIAPYQVFPAADGGLMITAANDGLFRRLVEAIGLPELADDPRFATNPDRVANRPALVEALSARLREDTRAAWLEKLAAAGVPAAPVQDVGEVASDPQLEAIGILQHLGGFTTLGPAFSVDGERPPTAHRRRARRAHGRGAGRGRLLRAGDLRPWPPRASPGGVTRLEGLRRDDLPGGDLAPEMRGHRGDLGLRHLRADLAEADAALLQAVDGIPAVEAARPATDLTARNTARSTFFVALVKDVRAEKRLVGVDADPPDVLRPGPHRGRRGRSRRRPRRPRPSPRRSG